MSAICKHCGEEKPLSEMRKDSRVPSGYLSECKSCKRKRERENGAYDRKLWRNTKERAAKYGAVDTLTWEEYREVIQRTECPYCGKKREDGERWHVDHIVPFPEGENSKENIVYTCPTCNLSKHRKDVLSFYLYDKERFNGDLLTSFLIEAAERKGTDYFTEYRILVDEFKKFTEKAGE